MTKERFRELVKKLHPDHSGTNRTLQSLRMVLAQWQRQKRRFRKCFCGVTIARTSRRCMMHRYAKVSGALAGLLVMAAMGGPPGVMRTNVTLAWDYPTNELSAALLFKIYSTTNLSQPLTNWPLLTTVAGTNLMVTIPMDAQQRFFIMTASNYWGESRPSNVAGTPPPPRDQNNLRLE